MYLDEDNIVRLLGVHNDFTKGINIVVGTEYVGTYYADTLYAKFGTFMVREAAVSEPATLLLLSLSLFGFGFMRRKR